MFTCPNCGHRLVRARSAHGFLHICPRCGGRAAAMSVVRRAAGEKIVQEIWSGARERRAARGRRCPMCNRWMAEMGVPIGRGALRLDLCCTCQFLWFDPKEFEQLPPAPVPPPSEADPVKRFPESAREKLAIAEVKFQTERAEREGSEEDAAQAPEEDWQWIPGIFGLPVETEAEPIQSPPWVTWGLAAVLVVVYVLTFQNLKAGVERFGFVPNAAFRLGGLTWLTSFFLHAGLWHLAANVYFLVVFGDNVEDFLGRWRYAVLLLAATILGGLAHAAVDPRGEIPSIGASGGISGVIVFYALRFPHARLAVLWWWISWLRFSALAGLMVWVLLQFLGVYLQVEGASNVSSLAHLGGAGAGLVAWAVWRGR